MNLCKFIAAVSPQIPEDEDDVADLFGPDEGEWDEATAEPATPSRDIVDGGEVRIDDSYELDSDEPIVAQTPVGIPSPDTPTAEEVALHWLTHTYHIDHGADGVYLVSAGMRLTDNCLNIPERYRCL